MIEETRGKGAPGRGRGSSLILGGMLLLAGPMVVPLSARVDPSGQNARPAVDPAPSATIHQEIELAASPDRVYEALLDAKQFAALTGGLPTEIAREAGGAFSCFGGHIVGRNVELLAKRRIVQAWRVAGWPEGLYSIARFELTPRQGGTRLIFDHTGFPPDLREHLAEGWEDHYWKGLRTLK